MVSAVTVQKQLKSIGASFPFFGKPEIDELPNILVEGEVIQHILFGWYAGGYAVLCATNFRILLVDKKLLFLNVEDVRYDMVAELDYGHQFFGATLHIRTFNKDMKFQSYKKQALRDFSSFLQKRVMELRQHNVEPASPTGMLIPVQTFNEPDNQLTPQQANSLLPLTREKWHRVTKSPKLLNPYTQSPLVTRRRIGRFNPS